jgi:hypothetical protein
MSTRERRPRRSEAEPTALLARHAAGFRPVDAWSAPIKLSETADAVEWAHAVFTLPPSVVFLMRVRDALARPFGLATGWTDLMPYTGFPLIAEGPNEVVLGLDDKHLDFKVGITTSDGRVVMTTVLRINNSFGHLYWAVVRPFHHWLARDMLGRARVPSRHGASGGPGRGLG